jgi:Fe2+ or Zn2+ uptake regulation protein
MEKLIASSEQRLRRDGKRITPQRKLVIEILAQSNRHLDACDIFERGRRQDTAISLATVYRTLNILKEAGVVHELHLEGDQHHYELNLDDQHSHLVCLQCGRILEVDSDAFVQAVEAAAQFHGFEIAHAHVEITGYCRQCQQRNSQPH